MNTNNINIETRQFEELRRWYLETLQTSLYANTFFDMMYGRPKKEEKITSWREEMKCD